MKIISAGAFSLFLMLGPLAFAQQNQQAAPPPTNQSSYPSETHKLSPQEKSDTPDANGQPVDLNTASKKDLAAARDRTRLRTDHHRRASFCVQAGFAEKETHSTSDL
jgi:hypothetical protein